MCRTLNRTFHPQSCKEPVHKRRSGDTHSGMQHVVDPNALRLICDTDSPAILGQGIIWNASLLAPLHVLDESTCAGEQSVALYQVGCEKPALTKLKLIQYFPSADAAAFSVDSDLTAAGSVTFAEEKAEGNEWFVQWLTFRRGAVCVESMHGKIREIVKIDRYEYRSASGAIVSVRDISAIFLDKQMPLGSSGAPVYHAGSGKILGFVHGNAAENDSFAICLDPKPIWESQSQCRQTVSVCGH
jgi:hypothetical protein